MVSHKKNQFVCNRYSQSGYGPVYCSFCTAQCHECGKLGHIKRMYQSKHASRGGGTLHTKWQAYTNRGNCKDVRTVQNKTTTQTEEYPLHKINSQAATKSLMADMIINDQSVSMDCIQGQPLQS